jgi:hypothetical protein
VSRDDIRQRLTAVIARAGDEVVDIVMDIVADGYNKVADVIEETLPSRTPKPPVPPGE